MSKEELLCRISAYQFEIQCLNKELDELEEQIADLQSEIDQLKADTPT